ncbi:MAG: hypothetical protein U0169_21480 [Polyangiaceae bacterium]
MSESVALRRSIDRMVDRLVDDILLAVGRAFRESGMDALDGAPESDSPRSRRGPPRSGVPLSKGPSSFPPPVPSSRGPGSRAPASRHHPSEITVTMPGTVVDDPALLLAALAAIDGTPASVGRNTSVARGNPRRSATSRASEDDDALDDDAGPLSLRGSSVKASLVPPAPPTRPGERVLRTSPGGGLVIRRQRT